MHDARLKELGVSRLLDLYASSMYYHHNAGASSLFQYCAKQVELLSPIFKP